MKKNIWKFLLGIFSFCLLFIVAACSSSDDDNFVISPPEQKHTHSVVFYMMGSSTGLEKYMDENLRRIVETAPNIVNDSCKIAVFYDRGNYTQLLEIKKVDGRTKKVLLKEWNPSTISSVDTTFMTNVLKETRQLLNTDTYGLIMSSHGGGWVPSEIFDEYMLQTNSKRADSATNNSKRISRFFGQDGNSFMETPQLAKAIEASGKWDYLLFDACFMSSVEGLYDLRHSADYIIASPSEVLGAGFPYQKILPLLFTTDHSLEKVCQAYMSSYVNSSATVALIKTSALDELAFAMKNVVSKSTTIDVDKIQGYEGFQPHLYFDLKQYTHAMTTSTAAFDAALAKVVVYTDHTPTIYTDYGPLKGNITMAESCGLTCHIPTAAHPNTQKAFLKTAWAKAIGVK